MREFLAKYTDELPDTDELDGDSTTGNVEEHRTQEDKNNKDIAAKSACGTPQALILYAERQEI